MKKPTIPLSAQTIKNLRSETGFPMMDCKRALLLFDGDYSAARKALLERRGKPLESGTNE
jgi:translation elongation factor EF-Ts